MSVQELNPMKIIPPALVDVRPDTMAPPGSGDERAGLHRGQALWAVVCPDGVFPALSYEAACSEAHRMTKASARAWARSIGGRLAHAEVTLSPYTGAEHFRLCAVNLQAQLDLAVDQLNRRASA